MAEKERNDDNTGKSEGKPGQGKRILLRTFGCQMNDYDSQKIMGILEAKGFESVSSEEEADVILFNTCSVRQHAEERVFGKINLLKPLKEKNPDLIIGICGCMAKLHKRHLFDKLPHIDIVCGPSNLFEIGVLIDHVIQQRRRLIAVDKHVAEFDHFPTKRDNPISAYITIMQGCNNFCSYCVVPFVRGIERSRKPKDVLDELQGLVDAGYKEVTLLGQNVNSFGKSLAQQGDQKVDLVWLLKAVDKMGVKRLRFTTNHPKDANERLFKAMAKLNSICPHLHMPVQSGSDKILDLMNRKYKAGHYLKLVELLRKHIPDAGLSTDIIVGFPSETDADFKKTIKLVSHVGFDSIFAFKYSPRPPAKASILKDDVPQEVKEARLDELLKLQEEISRKKNAALIGSVQEVLVESLNKRNQLFGRTRHNRICVFEGDSKLIGSIVNVTIERSTPHTLIGNLSDA